MIRAHDSFPQRRRGGLAGEARWRAGAACAVSRVAGCGPVRANLPLHEWVEEHALFLSEHHGESLLRVRNELLEQELNLDKARDEEEVVLWFVPMARYESGTYRMAASSSACRGPRMVLLPRNSHGMGSSSRAGGSRAARYLAAQVPALRRPGCSLSPPRPPPRRRSRPRGLLRCLHPLFRRGVGVARRYTLRGTMGYPCSRRSTPRSNGRSLFLLGS